MNTPNLKNMKTKNLLLLSFSFCLSSISYSQNYQWAKECGGTLDDEIFDITHDASGNIYVTGIFEGTADLDPGTGTANFTAIGAGDMFFAKYDASGNYLWAKVVGSIDDEEGQGIKLDGSGNIYLTGLFSGVADFDPGSGTVNLTSNGGFDVYIAKYDNSGNYIWAKSFGDINNADDYPSKMAVDGSGNVYVTGQFGGACDFDAGAGTDNISSSGGWDIFFTKYDASGNYVWAKTIDNTANNDDFGYNIALDASNNVFITGQFDGTCDFDAGTGTANLTSAGSWDLFFAKYDNSGNYIWAKNIGGTGDDAGNSIAIDGSGNVFVAGYYTGTADFDAGAGTDNHTSVGAEDICYFKYDNSGSFAWAKSIGGSSTDLANCITFDEFGSVLLTGQFSTTADLDPGTGTANSTSVGSWDMFFAKYHGDGSYYWSAAIGGVGVDQSHVIDYLSAGYFAIAGEHPDMVDFDPGAGTANLTSFGLDDIFFVKYYDATTGVEENNAFSSNVSVYPNPASNIVKVNVIENGFVTIFDITGKELANWKLTEDKNEFDISDLTNGVYFMKIEGGNKFCTRKLLVIK